jgi:ribosomal protein L27
MMRSAESQDTISPNLIADNMAIAFVKSSVAGRGGGKSATAMAAYRSGSIIVDKASGKIHDGGNAEFGQNSTLRLKAAF